ISINDITQHEPDGAMIFKVKLTGNIQNELPIRYTTADITAMDSLDYLAKTGIITFPEGSRSGKEFSISVPIINDLIIEPTEQFSVNLRHQSISDHFVEITKSIGTGTILDDDIHQVNFMLEQLQAGSEDGDT